MPRSTCWQRKRVMVRFLEHWQFLLWTEASYFTATVHELQSLKMKTWIQDKQANLTRCCTLPSSLTFTRPLVWRFNTITWPKNSTFLGLVKWARPLQWGPEQACKSNVGSSRTFSFGNGDFNLKWKYTLCNENKLLQKGRRDRWGQLDTVNPVAQWITLH